MSFSLSKNNKDRGFTLAEILVVITIISILVIGIVSIYLVHARLSSNEIRSSQATLQLSIQLGNIISIANQGTEILELTNMQGEAYQTSSTTVILSVPSIDATGNAISGSYDVVVYTKDVNNNLVQITEVSAQSARASGERILMADISDLTFNYQNEANVVESTWFEVRLSQQITTSRGLQIVSLSKRVSLMNKWSTE